MLKKHMMNRYMGKIKYKDIMKNQSLERWNENGKEESEMDERRRDRTDTSSEE